MGPREGRSVSRTGGTSWQQKKGRPASGEMRGGGALLGLLILPLYVPVLIFGVGAADPAATAGWSAANLSLLGAALCAGVSLCPWASAAALRITME